MKLLHWWKGYRQRQNLRRVTYDTVPAFSLQGYSGWVKVVKVIDGDTVHAALYLHNQIYRWSCRLQGIDCAEMRSKDPTIKAHAEKAKIRLQQLIGNDLVWAVFGKSEKYGRPLVDLSTRPQSPTFSTILLQEQLAYPYNGGKKQDFANLLSV